MTDMIAPSRGRMASPMAVTVTKMSFRRDRQPQPEPRPTRARYPTAERTNNPNQVLSPYAPYNVIDVEGFRSGQLAKDPSNGKIFRIP